MGARFVQDGMGAEARCGNSMQASIPPAVILSEAKDPCNRLRRHRAVILSEAKDPIPVRTLSAIAGNSFHALVFIHHAQAPSVSFLMLSEAKHPALRLRGRAALQGRVTRIL